MEYSAGSYDVLVIGAGHAGIEAALAAARLGCSVAIFTINLDAVGNLPCNPSIGGTAKGHLVRELDALGGEMGRAADASLIQSRMLNRGKGPAVHSLRAQIDRKRYTVYMKHALELQSGVHLRQAEIVDLRPLPDGRWQAVTRLGAVYEATAVVLATGTFLGGKIYIGDTAYEGGPDGMFPAAFLSEPLQKLGLSLRRFKTGTPARVLRSSVDFSHLEEQLGDEPIVPFSFDTQTPLQNRALCHITWTNASTKEVILKNLHRSPLYGGKIEGVGPRYCPSIEDKIVRFSEKERHQVFIEPCGLDTEELYLQGLSSSLPEEVQIAFYHSIPGLEHAVVMRTAYAIEYDCVDPIQMNTSLEFMTHTGLFGAGQFNGSSGYEEAAAQGLVAGINAAKRVQGRPPLLLDRASSYIGTLIDDLVTKGVSDPYRMMTSRSEYRLVLRQDNADERLLPLGREIGLVGDEKWERFVSQSAYKEKELSRLRATSLSPASGINELLVSRGTSPISTGIKLAELLKRPEISYKDLAPYDSERPSLPDSIAEKVEIQIQYEGYIRRQLLQIAEMRRLEVKSLAHIKDYYAITALRLEAREKLSKIRPDNLGQASRISGVSPADISVLMIWLSGQDKRGEDVVE